MHPKILAVDDSKTIRMIVSKAFKTFDCDVFEATNGLEGLSIAGKEKPDVIILDITMPVMDGYEMLNRLRADRYRGWFSGADQELHAAQATGHREALGLVFRHLQGDGASGITRIAFRRGSTLDDMLVQIGRAHV